MNKITRYFTYTIILITTLLVLVAPISTVHAALTPPAAQTEVYKEDPTGNPIWKWIQFFMDWLTVVIVAGSSLMIAYAGIRYISSRDNAQGVQAAKEQISNVLLGLLAYFFLYGFLQWLVPGGVF